ncbi:phospholipase D family protein [Pontivivens nitratireducens]|uniref:Phospholipase D n=1 Tax=Pontivivens nitratireducens TaxID=2758038 RepID=A0A6G7VQM2_9RHOB|nr:phospholipase D family protein [Pontibrevibacter nitratireducens]QIK42220.1 phospholipase D family protein [Pontibrevibacter nitratireducens]
MLFSILQFLLFVACFLGLAIIIARVSFSVPPVANRSQEFALPPATEGRLSEALKEQAQRHPELSGISPLENGMDAFVARMMLAGAAVSSIDVQYYIWRADMTGHLLLKALLHAADRGVRVRLLLDDNGVDGLDDVLASMDAHRNIEVRLFNPFMLRRFKRLSYAFDFFRLNHRMHNKAFTVDGRASILGGRNIGDEYFGTGKNPLQMDLDVLAAGEVVSHISADFDRYWNAASVHEAAFILGKVRQPDLLTMRLARFADAPQYSDYRASLEDSDIVTSLKEGTLALEWTSADLISDDPDKIMGRASEAELFTTRLRDAMKPIEHRFDGVTPYFVPGERGQEAFASLRERGVAVRMLTNSLEATNMLPVHAGYSKRRKDLLRMGVGLFELRAQAAAPSDGDKLARLGSSGSNLHAKTFAVDGARIFIGSFNFDPRSAMLNTEMGLVIESERMAQALHHAFDTGLRGLTWQLRLQDGKPVWTEGTTTIEKEPGTSLHNRIVLRLIGWLPVEWLL